jgi:hypothetical protein
MTKQKLKLGELAQSIKDFEDVHKKNGLFENDGSLSGGGWDYLNDAEVNWADDIKWNDYTKFHLRSRLGEYWYGNGGEEDIDYYEAWLELHPTGTMEIYVKKRKGKKK